MNIIISGNKTSDSQGTIFASLVDWQKEAEVLVGQESWGFAICRHENGVDATKTLCNHAAELFGSDFEWGAIPPHFLSVSLNDAMRELIELADIEKAPESYFGAKILAGGVS